MINQRVLVTGASGFIGQNLCPYLTDSKFIVRKALRRKPATAAPNADDYCLVGNMDAQTDWASALQGIDAIVHLAARVHVLKEEATDALAEFRKVNVEGTLNLARQAMQANVRRFIFVSSIKVNGEQTTDHHFTEADTPAPQDAYGISKLEAENALLALAQETGLEVVILRPPLIYGPAVKANFYHLMQAVYKGWPLPLGGVQNKRSLLYVGAFADAIKTCLTHPQANGKTYLVSDEHSLSTTALIKELGKCLQCSPRLLNVPVSWMKFGSSLLGKGAAIDKLTSSLAVDSRLIKQELNWSAPESFMTGMQKTADWFLATQTGQPQPVAQDAWQSSLVSAESSAIKSVQ